MTKKEMQNLTNAICSEVYQDAMCECMVALPKRLRTCSANVYQTPHYSVLISYNTVVAVIDKRVNVCYDVLRMVYGFTATSSQHISKFCKDYGVGKWGVEQHLVYRA